MLSPVQGRVSFERGGKGEEEDVQLVRGYEGN